LDPSDPEGCAAAWFVMATFFEPEPPEAGSRAMSLPDALHCLRCHGDIPQDFSLCPRCGFDPSRDQIVERRERKRRLLQEWGEWLVALSFALGFFCHFLVFMDVSSSRGNRLPFVTVIAAIGAALLVQAGMIGALMKNRSRWWGLLGLLSVPGALVVLLLRKSCRNCPTLYWFSCPRCSPPVDERG
jgi:hypothetical protein